MRTPLIQMIFSSINTLAVLKQFKWPKMPWAIVSFQTTPPPMRTMEMLLVRLPPS
jgi:hypothetical protein